MLNHLLLRFGGFMPLLSIIIFGASGNKAQAAILEARHVVIVGCDGLSPDGIRHANAPVFSELMKSGAYTMHARGVMPTSSSPNWASMIMGAGPEQHGVTSNEWETNRFEIPPLVVGPGGMFPTIFGVLREQRPSAVIACFHDWDGFGRLFERSALNQVEHCAGPTNTVRHAVAYFQSQHPNFTFIHLDHVDHAGHEFGHGTAEYYSAVEVADHLIGEVIEGLRAAGMLEQTALIVTADHGGIGKKHGGATLQEIEIPWLIHGPGVAKGHQILGAVNTYDTALTIAYIFGLKPPDCWIGRSVREAFD
jgi:predicted AlkP superfamily pyrophosphatase or phosphodiesterase